MDRKAKQLNFLAKRKNFDKNVQKYKRDYWFKMQNELEDQCDHNTKNFGKILGAWELALKEGIKFPWML
ncbi:MAG: hypothetical protein AB2693_33395 [Candidatus Thiodiazotropha sp.]